MQLFEAIRQSKSIREILTSVLPYASSRGLSRLRYYHYSQQEGKLVSVESAGHEPELAARFRKGLIVKHFTSGSLGSWDSFWCFSLSEPVIVSIEKRSGLPLRPAEEQGIKVLRIPKEQCGALLKGHKATMWVDFPLKIAGNYVGKMSCDLQTRRIGGSTKSKLYHFWQIAQLAAPYLEAFFVQEVAPAVSSGAPLAGEGLPPGMLPRQAPPELREVISRMENCKTSAELLDFLVDELPRRLFECRYASYFGGLTDCQESRKLVLRRSSYPDRRKDENLAFYDLDKDASLTTWIARTRRTLRLHDLPGAGAGQMPEGYGGDPKWLNKVQDSDNHKSFLGGAVLTDCGDLQGVLRLTQKVSKAGKFSERDERLLRVLLRDVIGPRLQHLRRAENDMRIIGPLRDVVSVAVKDSVEKADLPDTFGDLLRTLFKDGPKSRKAFIINLLNEDRSGFMHVHLGGSLPFVAFDGQEFPLKGTFTGLVLESGRPGTMFLHDFNRCGIEEAIRTRAPDARCGMVCPISFGGERIGIMGVLSDHYDLEPESHGLLLELVCIQAGGIYGCRTLGSLRVSEAGLRHDLVNVLRSCEEQLVGAPNQAITRKANDLVSFALILLDAYCRPFPVAPQMLERGRIHLNLSRELELVLAAAQSATGYVSKVEWDLRTNGSVLVYAGPVLTVVFNLLKNALVASGNRGAVAVGSGLNDSRLEITVRSSGDVPPISHLRDLVRLDPVRLSDVRAREGECEFRKGLSLCSRLAHFYKLPDGRRGAIRVSEGEYPFSCEVSLTIPI